MLQASDVFSTICFSHSYEGWAELFGRASEKSQVPVAYDLEVLLQQLKSGAVKRRLNKAFL